MKLLKMSSNQCLIFSAAMVLGEHPEDLCTEIGHDGLDIVFPLPPPACYRGHHIQEIQDLFLARGKCLYEVELNPLSGHPDSTRYVRPYDNPRARFERLIKNRQGILVSGTHAVAWDGEIIYDPNGRNYGLEKFNPIMAFLVGKI